ncbi:hypothetical protein ASD04_16970 [Devosia sp. Root436]|jgi:DNA-binding transcriptional LysR family regulator|uniref:LysR family transcriptional regulator n=1 Tax=Devosia sp. Root436 TaxID=1736537 RepID=UPI0006F20A18|nr:LysR family transcriptional regulator [Devosia sp. Root436]KQX34329.1 hypothetical protein ASD04_16970 [Devosia sp. Root436]
MRFDWNDMRYFLEVARLGTLSAAARTLATDHATVARRILALEKALSQTLFHRSPLGYMLTPNGEALLPVAEQMEARASEAVSRMGRPELGLSGTVRLVTPEGFGNHFLAHHLGAFAAAYPRLQLELVTIQQILSLSQREGDIAVTLSPPRTGRFAVGKLADYYLRLYAGAGYTERAETIARRKDLSAHDFIGYVDELIFTKELDYLGEVLPGLRARLQCSSLFAQTVATRAGLGLCVLPTYLAGPDDDLQVVLAGEVLLKRSYWVSAHEEMSNMPRIKAVWGFLERICRDEPHFQLPR